MNFYAHLDELRTEGKFSVLPMMVKSVRIENIGPIREFSAQFSKGVNIVYGPNGCGKTVLIQTLHDFFLSERGELRHGLTHRSVEGRVTVIPYRPQTTFVYAEIRSADGAVTRDAKRCALLDEPVDAVTAKDTAEFLAFVRKHFAQAILTTHNKNKWNLDEARLVEMDMRR